MSPPSDSGAPTDRLEPQEGPAEPFQDPKLRPLSGVPKIGSLVDGTIIEVISRVGVIVDINAAYAAFLPADEFGKRIKRPHKGYRLVFLEVVNVDLEADEPQKIILGGEHVINLTPSPMLVTPTSSCLVSPEVSRRSSPEPSRPPSPVLSAATSPVLTACAEPSRRVSPPPSRRVSPPLSRRTSPTQSRGPSPIQSRRTSPTQSGCTSPVSTFQPLPPILEPEPLALPPSIQDLADKGPPGLIPADAVPWEPRQEPRQQELRQRQRQERLHEQVAEEPQQEPRQQELRHRQRQERLHEQVAEEPRRLEPRGRQRQERLHEPVAEVSQHVQAVSQHAEATVQTSALRRGQAAFVEPLRAALLSRAAELGIRRSQLRPVLRCLDVLELQLVVADKATELGVPHARMTPVFRSLDCLCGPMAVKGPPEREPARGRVRLRSARLQRELERE